jgi:hypothetical protein
VLTDALVLLSTACVFVALSILLCRLLVSLKHLLAAGSILPLLAKTALDHNPEEHLSVRILNSFLIRNLYIHSKAAGMFWKLDASEEMRFPTYLWPRLPTFVVMGTVACLRRLTRAFIIAGCIREI